MQVLVAMSGGVDSSVAAALLVEQGHQVTGVTLKLWGGESDSGCCSVSDVDDARRVAQQLGIDYHVFNLSDAFTNNVVDPYVRAHQVARTPNPCIECNRHLKFSELFDRMERLGFDQLATGHHARVVDSARNSGHKALARGADALKDQSYVLSMLDQRRLQKLSFPIGAMTKDEVRAHAMRLGLRTASKPDSQDVCFISKTAGRQGFLGSRLDLHDATIRDLSGSTVGTVTAVELVTLGQRRGMGFSSTGERQYVVGVDPVAREVRVGPLEAALSAEVPLDPLSITWTDEPLALSARIIAQVSAHGHPLPAMLEPTGDGITVRFETSQRLVAPGQTIAFYDPATDEVLGAGIVA